MTHSKKERESMHGATSSKVKIFVGYHKPNIIFHSDVFQPILTANVDWENEPKVQKDSIGINIAEKSKNYGELTGHYWVWKNFLPTTNAEYIGFCHYRRFLDFNISTDSKIAFKPTSETNFSEIFKQYTQENIYNSIKDYDIVLPQKFLLDGKIYDQYITYHPKRDLDIALAILKRLYPEYSEAAETFMAEEEFYTCLHFIMKKELVNQYMEWMFNILTVLEQVSDWSEYDKYMSVRTPAYIAERFLNIWLAHNIKTRNLKTLNTSSIILVGENYCNLTNENTYKQIYDWQNDLLKAKKEKN